MSSYRVDAIDQAIMRVLQDDGRASFSRIASQVGLSTDAVRLRVFRLTNEGILKVIGAVDPASLGLAAVAAFGLQYHGDLQKFVESLRGREEITFLAVAVGDRNVIGEIVGRDDNALVDFLYGELAAREGVVAVDIWKSLQVIKFDTGFRLTPRARPLAHKPGELDPLDTRLLRLLAQDPRASFSDIAKSLGVPYAVARRRSKALFDLGVIQAAAVIDRVSTRPQCLAMLGLVLAGPDTREALEDLAGYEEVEILIRTTGRYQAIAEVAADTPDRLVELADLISGNPAVRQVHLYSYARVEVLPFPWTFTRSEGPAPVESVIARQRIVRLPND